MQWIQAKKDLLPVYNLALRRLAKELSTAHQDDWLSDFETSQQNSRANQLLASAIHDNYEGSADHAIQEAILARSLFQKTGNAAGVARSQSEHVYALRRKSKAEDCLRELNLQQQFLTHHRFIALDIEAAYEYAACSAMQKHAETAKKYAKLATQKVMTARYPSLDLRIRSLESALDTSSGWTSQSWRIDQRGLDEFWNGTYRAERAFQFYSDLQEASGQDDLWHTAALLQQEAIAMLNETSRIDFKAIAYFQLGLLYQRSNEGRKAQLVLSKAESLFSMLPESETTRFYKAYVATELSTLQAEEGQAAEAKQRLESIQNTIFQTNNFLVQAPYYQALAEVDRQLNQPRSEILNLQKTIEINEKVLLSLHTEQEKWQQYKKMDGAYHRLLELQIREQQSDTQTLLSWERYRSIQVKNIYRASKAFNQPNEDQRAISYLNKLSNATVISFAVFPHWTSIWIADNRGIQRKEIQVSSDELDHAVRHFIALCSDQNTPIEKVNSSGLRLYNLLLKPVESMLAPERLLLIEGDGILNRIPWSAISTTNQEYLADRFVVVNSSGIFYAAQTGIDHTTYFDKAVVVYPGGVSIHGHTYPPLPQAEKETKAVAGMLPNALPLQGSEATTARFLHELNRASIVHFAGHAQTRASGGELLFHDGPLSTATLEHVQLNHSLIVLSACSTGIAESEDSSRDPNGLVRAFLAAGAREVIATQWDADSGASYAFSKAFYVELMKSKNVVHSVAQAQRAMRLNPSDPRMKHPFYWGAFSLYKTAN